VLVFSSSASALAKWRTNKLEKCNKKKGATSKEQKQTGNDDVTHQIFNTTSVSKKLPPCVTELVLSPLTAVDVTASRPASLSDHVSLDHLHFDI
jgi:hypothetical protein